LPTAAFIHLGCKVNQYEIEKLAESFALRGFEIVDFDQPADIYVINTCSVTSAADRKSRQLARRAARGKEGAKVVITGCFAQMAVDEKIDVEGASLIAPNRDKMRVADLALEAFPDLASSLPAALPKQIDNDRPLAVFPNPESAIQIALPKNLTRTRATLKVQDGCEHFCAFCSIPYTRNVMASRRFEDTIAEAREMARRGVKEVVVTGVCVGAYSDEGRSLADLLGSIAEVDGIERVRLSSIQPVEVDDSLISVMTAHKSICRHLHLSLQSGSSAVLKAMRRPYDAQYFREKAARLRESMPEIALTTDIIVGFPGETDAMFDETMSFAQEMQFSRIHAFRYSPRARTFAAEHFIDNVPAHVKEARHKALTLLGQTMAADFARRFVGRILPVLAETRLGADGEWTGHTESYIPTRFASTENIAGQIVQALITSIGDGRNSGFHSRIVEPISTLPSSTRA